jgi:hypothetical protein
MALDAVCQEVPKEPWQVSPEGLQDYTHLHKRKQLVLDDLAKRVKNLPADEDIEYYLETEHGIQVQDNGLIMAWFLGKVEKTIIGDNAVLLFHHTASGALPEILGEGLVAGKHAVNLQSPVTKASGVYVTLRDSGADVDGYLNAARAYYGGDGLTLEVRSRITDLLPDPDDADLSSGRYQYVLPYIGLADIVNLSEVLKGYPDLQDSRRRIHG